MYQYNTSIKIIKKILIKCNTYYMTQSTFNDNKYDTSIVICIEWQHLLKIIHKFLLNAILITQHNLRDTILWTCPTNWKVYGGLTLS